MLREPVLRRLRRVSSAPTSSAGSRFSLFYRLGARRRRSSRRGDRDAGLQRAGGDRRLDPLAARARLPARTSSRWWSSTTARPTPRSPRSAPWPPSQPARARDRLPREPRQARRDGGRHQRDQRRGRRVRRLRLGRSSPDALRSLVQGFADPRVGAIAGHADVLNVARDLDHAHAGGALLRRVPGRARRPSRCSARSPAARAASPPTAARRSCRALDGWEHQRFLGPSRTYGDDRSLTNCVLRDWRVRYETRAVSPHDRAGALPPVPAPAAALEAQLDARVADRLAVHLAQATRSPAVLTYLGIVLPLMAPVVGGAGDRVDAARSRAAARRSSTCSGSTRWRSSTRLYYGLRQERYDTLWVFGVAVRLLLPGVPAVADLLRDRHLPQLRLGDAAGHRGHAVGEGRN